jgi:hypothetical protein
LVDSGNGILNRTKLRFVCTEWWRAVRGVKGLAMNGLANAARPPLDSAPGSQNLECLLTAPTTLYTGFSEAGRLDRIKGLGTKLKTLKQFG